MPAKRWDDFRMFGRNEVGTAPPRGRPRVPHSDVEHGLSESLREDVRLPERAVVFGSPASCPACGSRRVIWGCDERQTRTRDEIHPVVWQETEWMADSFICQQCDAGWIETDEPEPITWVRPYWRVR